MKRRQRLVLCVAPTAALAPAAIEAAVAEAFGVRPSVVVLTAEALAAYRTSAGKVKRSAGERLCREWKRFVYRSEVRKYSRAWQAPEVKR